MSARLTGIAGAVSRAIVVLVLVLFALLPIYWMVLVALSPDGRTMTWPPRMWPDFGTLTLDGLRSADGPVTAWLWNSLRLATFATVATLMIALPTGYLLARRRHLEIRVVGVLLLVSKMVPASLLIVPLYILFRRTGLLNTDPAVVLAVLSYTIPFAAWLTSVFMRTIPPEIEEAARIDGAGEIRVFFTITLPLSMPAIAAVTLYSFIVAWNDYIFARTFLPLGERTTLSVGATTLIGDFILEWSSVMSVAVVATLPPLVLFIVMQRHFVAGLVSGHD